MAEKISVEFHEQELPGGLLTRVTAKPSEGVLPVSWSGAAHRHFQQTPADVRPRFDGSYSIVAEVSSDKVDVVKANIQAACDYANQVCGLV